MKNHLRCSLFFILSILLHIGSCKIMTVPESQKIMENLFTDGQFINSAIPAYPGKPVLVQLWMKFVDMVPLDFFYNHIFAELLIYQGWKDDRLRFNSTVPNATIILTGGNVGAIWLPDIWITNERGERRSTFPSHESTAIIRTDGSVQLTLRCSIDVFCPMNYAYFPFDHQSCDLQLESYAYNTDLMRLVKHRTLPTVQFKEGFRIKDFILNKEQGVEVITSALDYGLTGIFDQVVIRFSLRRDVYYYLMEYYFPLILIVATSWISFWIDYRCVAARATLPVTAFLTLMSIAESLRAKDAGSLAYSTVLEIYINVCTFYVFAALLEFTAIGAVDHILRMRLKKAQNDERRKDSGSDKPLSNNDENGTACQDGVQLEFPNSETLSHGNSNREESKQASKEEGSKNNDRRARKISLPQKVGIALQEKYVKTELRRCNMLDEYSKVIFPMSFILFNIVYAVVCISAD